MLPPLPGRGINIPAPTKEDMVRKPVNMVAFGDGVLRSIDPEVVVVFRNSHLNLNPIAPRRAGGALLQQPISQQPTFVRHRGRFNRVYCDGHLEAENLNRPGNFSDDYLRQWNIDNEPHRADWLRWL